MPIRLALLAALVALLAALTPTASAGTPGSWTMLGQPNLDNIDEATLARTADGVLHAVWTIPSHNNGGGGDDLVHDAIAPSGAAAAPNPVTAGWASITAVPALVRTPDGGLRLFFGGIRTTAPNEPNDNMNTATADAGGGSWSLFGGTIVKGDSAYGGDDGAALLGDGTPLIAFGGTGAGMFVHRGLDPNTSNYELQHQLGNCCGYSPQVAFDSATGGAFVGWLSNATNQQGLFVQQLDAGSGAPLASPIHMPDSSTTENGVVNHNQQLMRTPLVARVGGGVFAAYGGGYPTTKNALLWKVGAASSQSLGTSAADHVTSLAAAPDGRLWVFWIERGSPVRIFARRSNTSATAFGPAVRLRPPAGQQSAYKIDGDAQTAALDLVVLFGGVGNQAQYHTQVLPGLALRAKPSKIKGSKSTAVKFTVTDPDPVKGAKVKAGGKSATTDSKGHATIKLGPTKKKSIAATATKAGYTLGTTRVKVKH
ncbi:MAG: hypothetical protein ACJ76Z_15745 [Thermoleophilaceae bacterium]